MDAINSDIEVSEVEQQIEVTLPSFVRKMETAD